MKRVITKGNKREGFTTTIQDGDSKAYGFGDSISSSIQFATTGFLVEELWKHGTSQSSSKTNGQRGQ